MIISDQGGAKKSESDNFASGPARWLIAKATALQSVNELWAASPAGT